MILDVIIDTHLAPLAFVRADELGVRLLQNVYTVAIWDMTPRRAVRQDITGCLSVYGNVSRMQDSRAILEVAAVHKPDQLCMHLHSLITTPQLPQIYRHQNEPALCRLDVENKGFIIRYLQQHLASTAASICLQHGMQIGNRIRSWFNASVDTNIASTRLKIASMLYCKGDLRMAADVLDDVERRYDNSVQAVCGCRRMDPLKTKPRETFVELLSEEDTDILLTNKVAYCVRFLRQEAFCAPNVLHSEMVKSIADDIQHRHISEHRIDSRPFLHYLQYFTFRGLGLRNRQLQALQSLDDSNIDGR